MELPVMIEKETAALAFLFNGGEMGELTRNYNWSQTSIGTPERWPQSLRTTLSIVLNAKFPMFLFWGDELICFYNDAFRPSLGNDGKHPSALGKKGSLVWAEIWPTIKPWIEQVLFGGEAVWMEDQLIPYYRNGNIEDIYWTFTYSPVIDEFGKIGGVLVVGTETTEKVLSFQKSKDRKKQLLNFFSQTPAAVAVLHGPEHIYTLANSLYQKLFSRTEKQLIGQSIKQVFPELETRGVYELLQQVFTTGEPYIDNDFPDCFMEDGKTKTVYYKFVAQPVKNTEGRVTDIMIHAFETTELVVTQKRLEESESRFRIMADAIPEIIWTSDAQGNNEFINKRWEDYCGVPFEQATAAKIAVEFIHPDDAPLVMAAFGEALKTGKPMEVEQRNRSASGEYRWFLNRATPYQDPQTGEITKWFGIGTDIHNRKMSELALLKSESRFQNLVHQATVGIILLVGQEMKVEIVNEAYGLIIDRKPEELLGRELFTIIPDAEETFRPIIDSVRVSGEPLYLYDTPFDIKKDDRTIAGFLNIVLQPQKNTEGTVTGVLILCNDITESVKANKAMLESEKRFRNVLEQAPDPILFLRGEDMVLDIANEPLFKLWKVGREAIGKPFLEILPEMKGQGFFEMLQDVYFNKKIIKGYETPAVFVRENGQEETIYFNFVYSPYYEADGTVSGVLVVASDVSPAVKAKQQLIESEDRFRTLAENLPQMVWMRTAEGKIEYASENWERYSGIKNISEAWKAMTHPNDWNVVMTVWEKALFANCGFRQDVRLKNKEGEYRWHNAAGEPIKDELGNVVKWIGALTDIHDQKTFVEKLEKLVTERTKELERSNEDLQQFAHVASHDLKEPVRKIMTFGDRLKYELGSELSEKAKNYISKIEGASRRMYSMIDGVLLYSSLGAGEQAPEKVDLNETMRFVETDLEMVIQQKQAIIYKEHLPLIKGSKVLLHQLFYNLINNALKFSKADVTPLIQIFTKKIKASDIAKDGLKDQQYLQIEINDNGIGFDQSQAEKIFKTFSRLNSKDKYEGTGLGLALCKKIVERHGGTIKAEGKEEEGATFTIILPIKQ